MTTGEMIALAGLSVTALGGLGWLGSLTFHGGRQAQKLDNALKDISDIRKTQNEHSSAIAAWTQALTLLEEVRHDVKNLLTGKISPGRRNNVSGD